MNDFLQIWGDVMQEAEDRLAEAKIAVDLGSVNPDSTADQRLYQFSPPITYSTFDWDAPDGEEETKHTTEYVVISALQAAFDTGRPETYAFPADAEGNILNWMELGFSLRGVCNHNAVIECAGYVLVEDEVIEAEYRELFDELYPTSDEPKMLKGE